MKVLVEGEASSETTVDSGVPKGTGLGPHLFLVLINDLPDSVKSSVKLFADDCLLFRIIRTIHDHLTLQEDLIQLEKWATDWGMRFNSKKCYILSINKKSSYFYQLNGTVLQHVDKNPYLGLLISNDLKWASHINKICKKASSILGFLRRNVSKCPQHCRKTAYISLVRSSLEYGSSIWDPHLQKDIDKLEAIQRRAARFITQDYHSREPGSMTSMLQELNLPQLEQRRKENRLGFLYKISNRLVPAISPEEYLTSLTNKRKIRAKSFHDCETRNFVTRQQILHDNCFVLPTSKTDVYKHSFFPRTISDWNQLDNTRYSTLDSFKNHLQSASI